MAFSKPTYLRVIINLAKPDLNLFFLCSTQHIFFLYFCHALRKGGQNITITQNPVQHQQTQQIITNSGLSTIQHESNTLTDNNKIQFTTLQVGSLSPIEIYSVYQTCLTGSIWLFDYFLYLELIGTDHITHARNVCHHIPAHQGRKRWSAAAQSQCGGQSQCQAADIQAADAVKYFDCNHNVCNESEYAAKA